MSTNPFRPAEQVAPKVKALVYGQSGVGKTYLALTAPGRIAVIDTEGGTAFYAGRRGLSEFDVLPTKTFNDVTQAIGYLRENPTAYETLVIDPVTVLYETLQDAAQIRRAERRKNPDADLEMLDWQQIKRAYKTLMTDLVNLPMHVIVTARERDDTERRGNESVKVGVRPDAEKSTEYYFDCVLRLTVTGDARRAEVRKDRTGTLPSVVDGPSFASLFTKAIKANRKGEADRGVQSDDDAATRDAETTFADGASLPHSDDGGLMGKVAVQGTQDFQLRHGSEGARLPFRIKEGRASVIALAENDLAEALAVLRDSLIGERITAWGTWTTETIEKRNEPNIEYAVFHVNRIQTPDFTLPAAGGVGTPVEPEVSEPEVSEQSGSEAVAPGQEALPLTEDERKLITAGLPE